MAWCDVVEPRTLRECRIALGKSQAAFAAMLGVSPESYRTWDAGRRATPPKILARARALATHRDDHALLPLPVLALLIGVHVKTLRAAARDGRLPVTYDTRTTFRRLRARATVADARAFRRSYYGRQVRLSGPTRTADVGERARGLRCANSRASSRARREPGTISHPGGRGAESRCLSMGGAETHAVARVLATTRRAPRARRQPLGTPFARSNGSGTPSTMRTVSTLTWDEPADRRDQNTRMVEPSMDRRLVHRAGREHLLAHSFARQYQRVKLLLRDT